MTLRTSSGILAGIVQQKQIEVAQLRPRAAILEQQAYDRNAQNSGAPSLDSAPTHQVRPFAQALRDKQPAVIAEIKKASPSKGVLQSDFHPAIIAHQYEQGGAACLSVLTAKEFFQGSLFDLEAARAAATLPVLRKDFIISRLQIFEAAAHGADAILLIAAILDGGELTTFRELASSLGMASLVEVHDADELAKAVDSGAEMIGVNNRNLDTFEVSLDTSLRLSYLMPSTVTRVSESGIYTRADIDVLLGAGYHAFLVGEALMRSSDPTAALQALLRQSS